MTSYVFFSAQRRSKLVTRMGRYVFLSTRRGALAFVTRMGRQKLASIQRALVFMTRIVTHALSSV